MSKENFNEKDKLFTGPDCGLASGQNGRLTVGHKVTLTLIRVCGWVDMAANLPGYDPG
jgi:hypothetical protein